MKRLTKDEKKVLLFLLATLFIGTGVLYYKKVNPAPRPLINFEEKEIKNYKKININKATMGDLMKLKGIGPAFAERIVSFREKHGPFENAEDIKRVKGIGERTYEKMKEQIKLE